jgi:hypothetical protein
MTREKGVSNYLIADRKKLQHAWECKACGVVGENGPGFMPYSEHARFTCQGRWNGP